MVTHWFLGFCHRAQNVSLRLIWCWFRCVMCKWFAWNTQNVRIGHLSRKIGEEFVRPNGREIQRVWDLAREEKKMFNDFLIWLPYSLIFHSFVPLYQHFWLCVCAVCCVYALARHCIWPIYFILFLFIPHRSGDIIRRPSIEISLPPVSQRERMKEIYTNTAQLKRREMREWKSSPPRKTNERRSNNLNKPKNWKQKQNEERKNNIWEQWRK